MFNYSVNVVFRNSVVGCIRVYLCMLVYVLPDIQELGATNRKQMFARTHSPLPSLKKPIFETWLRFVNERSVYPESLQVDRTCLLGVLALSESSRDIVTPCYEIRVVARGNSGICICLLLKEFASH